MAKNRKRGKLSASLDDNQSTPSAEDIDKMMAETEDSTTSKKIKEKSKKKQNIKIGTEVDADLYKEFKATVSKRGVKLKFAFESMMRNYIENN